MLRALTFITVWQQTNGQPHRRPHLCSPLVINWINYQPLTVQSTKLPLFPNNQTLGDVLNSPYSNANTASFWKGKEVTYRSNVGCPQDKCFKGIISTAYLLTVNHSMSMWERNHDQILTVIRIGYPAPSKVQKAKFPAVTNPSLKEGQPALLSFYSRSW